MTFKHLRTWFITGSAILFTMGILLAFTPLMQRLVGPFYYNVFFEGDAYINLSKSALIFQRFIYGVSGGAVMGWSIGLLYLSKKRFHLQEKWVFNLFLVSILAWFIGDTYASVITGFWIHGLMNLSILLLVGIPLLLSKKYFIK